MCELGDQPFTGATGVSAPTGGVAGDGFCLRTLNYGALFSAGPPAIPQSPPPPLSPAAASAGFQMAPIPLRYTPSSYLAYLAGGMSVSCVR